MRDLWPSFATLVVCVTFLHQVLFKSVCLYTYRVSKKKQETEYVQMTFTSVLTVLRGLRKLFSASCSIVNARLEMITCLSIICFGCKSLLFLFLSSFFLLLRRSHVSAISALIVNEQIMFCVFCRRIFAEDLRSQAFVARWGWQKLARSRVSLSPNHCWSELQRRGVRSAITIGGNLFLLALFLLIGGKVSGWS